VDLFCFSRRNIRVSTGNVTLLLHARWSFLLSARSTIPGPINPLIHQSPLAFGSGYAGLRNIRARIHRQVMAGDIRLYTSARNLDYQVYSVAITRSRMPSETKHRQIFSALAAEIGAGQYRNTGRLPSESQLVSRFRASRPTVVRALRDLQAKGLVTRRAGAGTFLAQAAHTAPPSGSRELGLLIPGVGRMEIFEIIAGELARLARAAGYLFWWTGNADPHSDAQASLRDAEEFCAQVIQRKVAGVFFAPFERTDLRYSANLTLVTKLHEAGCAVVLLDRDIGPFPERSDFDLVGIDNFLAGHTLAEHLIKLGSQRIAFVAYPHCAHTIDARVAGAREAILSHKLEVPTPFFWKGDTDDARFVRQLSAGRLLDAVICGNDYTAAQLIRSLTKLAVRVPRDLRVVGLDDVHYATIISPSLTTIHQPCRDIAAIAFDALLARISDPDKPSRTLLLTPHLVVRESCGAYLSNPAQARGK